jgi:hypothetical protein
MEKELYGVKFSQPEDAESFYSKVINKTGMVTGHAQ